MKLDLRCNFPNFRHVLSSSGFNIKTFQFSSEYMGWCTKCPRGQWPCPCMDNVHGSTSSCKHIYLYTQSSVVMNSVTLCPCMFTVCHNTVQLWTLPTAVKPAITVGILVSLLGFWVSKFEFVDKFKLMEDMFLFLTWLHQIQTLLLCEGLDLLSSRPMWDCCHA